MIDRYHARSFLGVWTLKTDISKKVDVDFFFFLTHNFLSTTYMSTLVTTDFNNIKKLQSASLDSIWWIASILGYLLRLL